MLYSLAIAPGKNRAPAAVIPVGRVRYTNHGETRVPTRSGLTHAEVEQMLEQGRAVYLGDNKTEGRSYFLFCSPKTREFFVAVASVEGPTATAWIITILDKAMHERDRGLLAASHLEEAARLALPEVEFAGWLATFDASAQQLDPKAVSLRLTYLEASGKTASLDIHPIAPAASNFFSGGKLQELRGFDPFWRWANKSLQQSLGVHAAGAVDSMLSIQLCHRGRPAADFLSASDRSILPRFRPRFHRTDITVFLTFALDCKLHQVQKNSPAIPAELLYEHLLPTLGSEPAVLGQLKSLLTKKVAAPHIDAAIRGLVEVQLQYPSATVDLLTENDRSIIERLLAA
jgi:hypothetical protein